MNSFKNHILYQFGFLISPEKLEELTALVFPLTQHSQNSPCSFFFFSAVFITSEAIFHSLCVFVTPIFLWSVPSPTIMSAHTCQTIWSQECLLLCWSWAPRKVLKCWRDGWQVIASWGWAPPASFRRDVHVLDCHSAPRPPPQLVSVISYLPDPIGFEFVISDKTYRYCEWTRFDRKIMRYGVSHRRE